MAATYKIKRAAGLSLAAAVAGSMTLVPIAGAQESSTAQESAVTVTESSTTTVTPTSTEPTVSKTQSATATTNNAGEVAAALQGLAGLAKAEQPVEDGAGTSGVEQASNGWEYTAIARNPQNDRLYAISKKKDTKGAGRLLRIAPQNGAVKDLGPIEIKGADATTIDTAAFTADGTLVLFDDTKIHTLDLSEDKPRSGAPKLTFVTKDLEIDDTKTAGTPAAWAPNAEAGKKNLVALSINDKGKPFVWDLDVDAKAPVATYKAATAPADADLKDVDPLTHAYTEGDEATFANDDVALTLQGEELTGVNTETTSDDNYAGVAGTGDKKSTETSEEKPTTTTSETTEATTTTTGTTTTTSTPANAEATKWVMNVLVRTSDDKAVEGAEFKSEDGRVAGVTGTDGRAKVRIGLNDDGKKEELIQLTLKEAPKGYKNAEVLVDRGAKTAEIVLPRDPNYTTLNRPQQILKAMDDLKPIATSVLAPAAAMAGAAGMVGGQKTTRKPLPKKSTSTSTTTTAKRSTGRTTSARNASRYSANRNSGSGRVVSNGSTSTKKTTTSRSNDERDGDLADTGTPMRAIISLGILAMLIGGAYLALGRRRES